MKKTLIEGYHVDWDGEAHPPQYWEHDRLKGDKHSGVRVAIVGALIILCFVVSSFPGGQGLAVIIGLVLVIYFLVWTLNHQSKELENLKNRPYCCKCGKYNGKRYHDVICEICNTKV